MFFFFFFFFLFLYFFFFFFFFQAEDGIRDDLVTGVQTCALPICLARWPPRRGRPCASRAAGPRPRWPAAPGRSAPRRSGAPRASASPRPSSEIGRASCRERV